jgi:ribosomal protein S21
MKNRKPYSSRKQIVSVVTVTSEECRGDAEKMVRKFIKKVKKEGILEECRERQHFKKPTTVRAEKKRDKKRLVKKLNSQRIALSTTRGYLKSKGRRR